MERNVLKKKWHVLFNELKQRWPDFTQSDIDYIEGDKARLIEIVRRRRHLPYDEAARDVEDFLNTLDARQRVA